VISQHFPSASFLPSLSGASAWPSRVCCGVSFPTTKASRLPPLERSLVHQQQQEQKVNISFIMSAAGTMRGTPKGAPSKLPTYQSNSAIPRPTFESVQSDAGASALSASRQKQSKRDEVCTPKDEAVSFTHSLTRQSAKKPRRTSTSANQPLQELVRAAKHLQDQSSHSNPVRLYKSSPILQYLRQPN